MGHFEESATRRWFFLANQFLHRGDNELLQQFLREKRILARLQHPNIARLLDVSAGLGMRRTL